MSRYVEITKDELTGKYNVNPDYTPPVAHKATIKTSISGSSGQVLTEETLSGLAEDSEFSFRTFIKSDGTIDWGIGTGATGIFEGLTKDKVTVCGLISEFRGSGIISENGGYGLSDDLSQILLDTSGIYNIQYTRIIVRIGQDSKEFNCGLAMNPLQADD